jgi:hypothetical protein
MEDQKDRDEQLTETIEMDMAMEELESRIAPSYWIKYD